MGITSIRLGGSFTDPSYYFWKKWRGVPWERPSLGAKWGSELVSGFGPFEFIDMCAEAGIEPIVTTTAQWGDEMGRTAETTCCSPSDMADLIEYSWGNSTTPYGKMRISDGHPAPYQLRFIELGNEQYNTLYVDQVKAMEDRAVAIGKPNFFYYMSPNNANWLNSSQADEAEALGLGDRIVSDMHVGAGGGVDKAKQLFSKFPGKTMGAVNAETNDGTHTMLRAAKEAADLNAWFNCWDVDKTGKFCKRLKFRTASFCNERSGHFDAFDQGISFFLPNMTWIQPPGYVHVMTKTTWAANGLQVTVGNNNSAPASTCDYYAFFGDRGCRTWSGACTEGHWAGKCPGAKSCPTLHKRAGLTSSNFTMVGGPASGLYCTNTPDFQDGPNETPTDDACKQRCIKGEHGGVPGSSSSVSVSAQLNDARTEVVVRMANVASKPVTVQLDFKAGANAAEWSGGTATVWTLSSKDPLGANTPANPTAIAPLKSTADLTVPLTLEATSVVVVVVPK